MEATLPVVIRRTCRNPAVRSASAMNNDLVMDEFGFWAVDTHDQTPSLKIICTLVSDLKA